MPDTAGTGFGSSRRHFAPRRPARIRIREAAGSAAGRCRWRHWPAAAPAVAPAVVPVAVR